MFRQFHISSHLISLYLLFDTFEIEFFIMLRMNQFTLVYSITILIVSMCLAMLLRSLTGLEFSTNNLRLSQHTVLITFAI